MKLKNLSALITGASQGLGAAIARAFVEQGASVMICSRSSETLQNIAAELQVIARSTGSQVHFLPADVARTTQIDDLVMETLRVFPDLHILVNNAGVYGPMGSLEDVPWKEWISAIEINLFGPVYLMRRLIPHFKARRRGKIINLSGGGATNPLPFISSYAASKAALVRMTETIALELRDLGIDVNSIAPGLLATRMTDQLLSVDPMTVGQEFYDRIKQASEGGGTPLEKGANLCVYLASEESNGITGKLISAPWDPWPFSEHAKETMAAGDIYALRRIVPEDRGKKF